MRYVTPHFLILALAALQGATALAQGEIPPIQGGGALTVDGRRLAFRPTEALAGPPQGGLKVKVLRLKGTFRGPRGENLDFELQVTEGGQIYRMNLFRKVADREVERWAATMKSQVKILELQGRVGGTVRLKLTGPLSGVVDGVGKQTTWDGELWCTLQSWPETGSRR
ncbi:MAG TPA: hypothetical protein VJ570_03135 [Holophagaceae bacterium]|nr:hypothetical protein [Holophagaceae bacterium]